VIWLDHIRRCASTRLSTASELRIRGSGRKERDVQILTSPSSESHSHQDCSFYTLIIDHHHRRAEEVALAQALKEHHRLINMIEGIVWEADETCTFTFVSRYAERLLGFPVKEWMRPGFWENRIFVQDRERVLHELGQAVANRKEVRIDYRVVAADRRLVWLHDCVTVIERNGRRQLLGVAIDVTEQRNAEGLLRQAHDSLEQRVAERTTELGNTVADLEAFSYSLSHDLRAPIRAMQGYAFLLKRLLGKTAPPQVGEFLQRIMRAAERLDLLVQDALNYNRLSRGPLELKPVSLEPLVDNILHDFPTLAPAKAKIDILKPLPVVYGHEAFVGQALSNLFTNAVKFVPHGRTPHVRVWAEAARGNAAGDGSWVRICVEDNGLGIAAEDQKRIFRMFERVYAQEQYEGTGIGLAIVQKAAERMGGCVGVHSTPGAGSKFWLELRQA
jgi:PAS domain S-box-containing protein